MKILFIMRYYSYIAHYEDALRELGKNGHKIHFGFNNLHNKPFDAQRMNTHFSSIPNTSYDFFPDLNKTSIWSGLAFINRKTIDYLRYLHPDYANAPKLVMRFKRRVPLPMRILFEGFLTKIFPVDFLISIFKNIEKIIPVNKTALEYIKKCAPDLVLFTPLMDSNTRFIDFAKAAKQLGVKTAICVASWDNLTNKGLIQVQTDKVIMWNEFQKEEAIKYHKVPEANIIVTGAQTFDKWFDKKPTATKEDFFKKVGFDNCRSFLLYVCSSQFIAKDEVPFVKEWVEKIKNTEELKDTGIMIRPHPANIQQWENVEFPNSQNVIVYPRWKGFAYPFSENDKNDYFDTLHYCSAVVGINTSAMIEAGIQTKPVFTVLSDYFKETQDGTLHFHYIKTGGLLYIGNNLDEHADQIVNTLFKDTSYKERIPKFIKDFLRPYGLNKPSTPFFVEAIENLMNECNVTAPEHERKQVYPVFRLVLYPLAVLLYGFNFEKKNKKFKLDKA